MDTFIHEAEAATTADAFGRAIQPIIENIVNPIVLLMFAVGVVVFVFGVVEMIIHAGDPDGRKKGRYHMLGGLIGMFIMLSAWGIVNIIANTVFEIEDNGTVNDRIDTPANWENRFEGQV